MKSRVRVVLVILMALAGLAALKRGEPSVCAGTDVPRVCVD